MTQLSTAGHYRRWLLVTAGVLAMPSIAMALRAQGVNWGPMDFAIVGVLVLCAGILFEYASSRAGNVAHRAAVGIAVVAALGLVWVNLAVGMIGNEGNPANLMYVLVLAVALIGASVGRFESREASLAMFGTAGAHVIVVLVALAANLGPELRADAVFIAAWIVSALLFRQASLGVGAAPSA